MVSGIPPEELASGYFKKHAHDALLHFCFVFTSIDPPSILPSVNEVLSVSVYVFKCFPELIEVCKVSFGPFTVDFHRGSAVPFLLHLLLPSAGGGSISAPFCYV